MSIEKLIIKDGESIHLNPAKSPKLMNQHQQSRQQEVSVRLMSYGNAMKAKRIMQKQNLDNSITE